MVGLRRPRFSFFKKDIEPLFALHLSGCGTTGDGLLFWTDACIWLKWARSSVG
jgi:hypothetical protein